MALARFKDLNLDANDTAALGKFWAAALDLQWVPADNGEGVLRGGTPEHSIWVDLVPEPKQAKNRVHLDIYARALADLEALGATVLWPEGGDRSWTVLADPEGGEFCAFLRADLPADRLHGLVVDSVDHAAQARWWTGVLGGRLISDDNRGFSTLEQVSGMPITTMDFVPVPEPKTVKNRVHWDITAPAIDPLVDAGAVLLRARDAEIGWSVLADPEGNEFCVFADEPAG
jgi:hypothetical protein